MYFLDLTLPTLAENLALDGALLLEAEAGGGLRLRTWHWPSSAVAGLPGGKLTEEVEETVCRYDRWRWPDVPVAAARWCWGRDAYSTA